MQTLTMLTPNFGYPRGTRGRNGHVPHIIVLHVSGGTWTSNRNWLMNPAAPASYNRYVRRDGQEVIFVPDENAAWAHGRINRPTTRALKAANINPNLYSLSLCREGHNHHEPTPEQYATMLRIIREWTMKYDISADRTTIIGHNEIDSVNRAFCPGSGWPWTKLMQDLLAIPARQEYIVARGDTLISISRRMGIALPALLAANPNIKDPASIRVGQRIILPEKDFSPVAFLTHRIVSGENLSRIASRHNVSLQDITEANPQIKNINAVTPGQRILIPVKSDG